MSTFIKEALGGDGRIIFYLMSLAVLSWSGEGVCHLLDKKNIANAIKTITYFIVGLTVLTAGVKLLNNVATILFG